MFTITLQLGQQASYPSLVDSHHRVVSHVCFKWENELRFNKTFVLKRPNEQSSLNQIYKGCSLCEQCGRQAKHDNGIILSVIWTINTVE